MSVDQIIGLVVTLLVMSIGLAGSVLPGLPSTPVVFVAAIGHRLYFGEASASTLVLVIIGLIALFSITLDYLASMVGARKLGATWRGVVGAILGAVVGLFFGPPGLILGPFAGALALEMLGGRNFDQAAKAGAGAVIGIFVGAIGKLACCVAMMSLFAFNVISRSGADMQILPAIGSFLP
jgi:uncharacterized protein